MNKSYIVLSCALATLVAHTAQATTFTIHNKSGFTVEVCPTWPGRNETYDTIGAGGSKFYDSVFSQIGSITWRQLIPSGKGMTCYKKYSKAIDSKVATLNNNFEIFNDGSYRSEFLWGENNSGTLSPLD